MDSQFGGDGASLVLQDHRLYALRGTPMTSVGELAAMLQVEPEWNPVKRECTITYHGHTVKLKPGSRTAIVDGKRRIKLLQRAYIKDWGEGESAFMVVPVVEVSKALGMWVSRDRQGNYHIHQPKEKRK